MTNRWWERVTEILNRERSSVSEETKANLINSGLMKQAGVKPTGIVERKAEMMTPDVVGYVVYKTTPADQAKTDANPTPPKPPVTFVPGPDTITMSAAKWEQHLADLEREKTRAAQAEASLAELQKIHNSVLQAIARPVNLVRALVGDVPIDPQTIGRILRGL